jgi:hypothetical protein
MSGPASFSLRIPYDYAFNHKLLIKGELGQQRHRALATAAEVSPNADRAVKRDIHQRARVEAVGPQRMMGFTLRTVIRPVTIGIGKLFRKALDRASKAV